MMHFIHSDRDAMSVELLFSRNASYVPVQLL
jgi:hypothetical protein